jgi:hypothetical protein
MKIASFALLYRELWRVFVDFSDVEYFMGVTINNVSDGVMDVLQKRILKENGLYFFYAI